MNHRWLVLYTLLFSGPAAFGQESRAPLSEWFAEIGVGAVFESSDQAADTGRLAQLRLGANLSRKWSFEAELVKDRMDFDAGFELDQTSVAFNLVQYNRVPLWNPYFLVGLGARRFELPDDSDTRPLVQVGVGGQWDLSANGTRLRIEARYRYAPLDSDTLPAIERGEPLLLLGLVIPLGPRL